MGQVARGPTQTPSHLAIAPARGRGGLEMRLPKVLRPFSRLVTALQGVRNALGDVAHELQALREVQQSSGPAVDRLDVLERQHHQFEAMCEGLLMKAEGKLRSANNAEARTRADKKTYEHLVDPLAEIGDEPEPTARDPDSGNNVPASEEERLQALRLGVALSPKQLAQRAKFGVR